MFKHTLSEMDFTTMASWPLFLHNKHKRPTAISKKCSDLVVWGYCFQGRKLYTHIIKYARIT